MGDWAFAIGYVFGSASASLYWWNGWRKERKELNHIIDVLERALKERP